MRALVAESNVVTRVTLTRILERAGFGVDELHDELAAVSLLYQPDPPELALLAIDTLLVDFGAICEAMREAKPDVFIVALVPDARRNELLRVLRGGADDFVIKPVTIQEADARVFVIQQTLAARGIITLPPQEAPEEPLPETFAEDLSTPFDDVLSVPAPASEPEPEPEPEPPAEPAAPEPEPLPEPLPEPPAEPATPEPETLLDRLAAIDVAQVFQSVFDQLGLGPSRVQDPATVQVLPFYTAWAPLIVRDGAEAMWMNVRLDLERTAAMRLYHVISRKATLDEEALEKLLRDIIGLVQDSIQRSLMQEGGLRIYVPVLPLALHTESFPSLTALFNKAGRQRSSALALARDVRVKVACTVEPIQPMKRSLTTLRRLDILASPVQTSGDHIMLLRDGILLSDDYIAKIRGFMQSHNLEREVAAFRPPPSITMFLYNLVDEET